MKYGQQERSGKKDALEEEGYALYSRHKKIPDMPIPANLSHGPVGYIGPRNLVLEQLQLLVMQLATFHSYHDVQFITILPEEEKEQWSWMRWLPHAKLQELNVRGVVYNQRDVYKRQEKMLVLTDEDTLITREQLDRGFKERMKEQER